MRIFCQLACRIGLAALIATPAAWAAQAATINGTVWNSETQLRSLSEADAVMAANSPVATFLSTGIDYPNKGMQISSGTTLSDFLGLDAASLSGNGDMQLTTTVMQFTGSLDYSGRQKIRVGSDDGFRLTFDGKLVMQHDGNRYFGYSDGVFDFDGPTTFTLTYWENTGLTGVEFLIADTIVTPSKVPVPGALPALATGLAGLALLRRHRARRGRATA